MQKTFEKFCLGVLYFGLALTLFVPLVLDNTFFFPFVQPKIVSFRIIIEVLITFYLGLCVINKEYVPKRNFILMALALFIAWSFAPSIFGIDFSLSFWGDMERGEGIISWLHFLAYFIMLSSVIKTEKIWHILFDISLGVTIFVSLLAVGQIFHFDIFYNTTGERISSTIGNAAFFAAFLILQLGLALYLLIKRKQNFFKIYYFLAAFLFLYVIFNTQTRGAVLGLVAGFIVSIIILLLSKTNNLKQRIVASSALLALIVFSGIAYTYRESEFIKSTPLYRVLSISLEEKTAQTRLATWNAAWVGWKEKFVTGYGMENFGYVFNKYFPPTIYEDEGSQVWFDRAHNFILDRGVTTGIVGLFLYLSFISYPIYFFARYFMKNEEEKNISILFIGLIVAFVVQNLFIFENAVNYFTLFFLYSFFAFLIARRKATSISKNIKTLDFALKVIFAIYIIAIWPIMNTTNIKPTYAGKLVASALDADPNKYSFFDIVKVFKTVFEVRTYGAPEFQLKFIEFVDNNLANAGQVVPDVLPILEYTDNQTAELLAAKPNDVKYYLLTMRHFNYTFASISEKKFERLNRALTFFPIMQKLSPTRPHVYQEAGYSHLYKFRNFKEDNDLENAAKEYDQAEKLFQEAVGLNPKVVESHINLIMLYLNRGAEDNNKIQNEVEAMDSSGAAFRTYDYLKNLISLSRNNESFLWIEKFSKMLTEIYPQDDQVWIDIALAQAYQGKNDEAIETAKKVIEYGGEGKKDQVDQFIKEVRAGKYKPTIKKK